MTTNHHSAIVTAEELGVTTRDFYSNQYENSKSDSPDRARASLLRRVHPIILGLNEDDVVLDLGAGRQILERQYLNSYCKSRHQPIPQAQIITLDIAELKKKQLLARNNKNIDHVRADGANLPFKDASFSLVISSMALDLMPPEAIGEVYRVLKPGCHALITLHHPALLPENLDQLLERSGLEVNERTVLRVWNYLRKNGILSHEPGSITTRFADYGFNLENIVEASDSADKWWELDLIKPESPSETINNISNTVAISEQKPANRQPREGRLSPSNTIVPY